MIKRSAEFTINFFRIEKELDITKNLDEFL
jgi:hypothetical protein